MPPLGRIFIVPDGIARAMGRSPRSDLQEVTFRPIIFHEMPLLTIAMLQCDPITRTFAAAHRVVGTNVQDDGGRDRGH